MVTNRDGNLVTFLGPARWGFLWPCWARNKFFKARFGPA